VNFSSSPPQKIFAFLMAYGPTPEELVKWMSDPQEIDRRAKRNRARSPNRPEGRHQQRAGVLGSLGLVADSLRAPAETRAMGNGEWSATEWAETRQGAGSSLLHSPQNVRQLRPLQSLWIDLPRLASPKNEPKEGQKRAWFVIDELASLQKAPPTPYGHYRKSKEQHNPVILGSKGRLSWNTYIRPIWLRSCWSQPANQHLAQGRKEPTAGRVGQARFIGKVRRSNGLRETHFDGSRGPGRNFGAGPPELNPLVMESEISGLPDLHAYMKYENYVTRFSFPYLDMGPPIAH